MAGIGVSYILQTASASFYTSDLVFRNNLALMDKLTLRDNSGTTSEIIQKLISFILLYGNNSNVLSEVFQ